LVWLAGRLVGLVGWFGWLVGWLAGWLVWWLVGWWLDGWFGGWLVWWLVCLINLLFFNTLL
jgi:hypothetical protein